MSAFTQGQQSQIGEFIISSSLNLIWNEKDKLDCLSLWTVLSQDPIIQLLQVTQQNVVQVMDMFQVTFEKLFFHKSSLNCF